MNTSINQQSLQGTGAAMTNFAGRWRCRRWMSCPEINLRRQHERARCSKNLVAGVWIATSRTSVSACYAFETGCMTTIHAAHRFGGAHVEPVRTGTSLALATFANQVVVQATRALRLRLVTFCKSRSPPGRALGVAATSCQQSWWQGSEL